MTTVVQALAQGLASRGVSSIFSLMSDDTAKLVVELERLGVAIFSTRHEHAAVGAADGCARSSGEVGVAVIGRGPGLTNALNALVTALKARSAVLVIVGDVAQCGEREVLARFGKDVSQRRLLAALDVPHVPLSSAATAAADFGVAIEWAAQGTPVVVSVPAEVFDALAGSEQSSLRCPARPAVGPPPADQVADVSMLLETTWASQRPVIIAGSGAVASGAGPALIRLADQIGAVLATTLPARSLFSGHERNIGIVGTFASPVATDLLGMADVVLSFGASLNGHTTYGGTLFPRARIVHIDIDPAALGLHVKAELTICGDARLVAIALADRLEADGFRADGYARVDAAERLRTWRPEFRDRSRPGAVDPRTLMAALDTLLPQERNVVIDPGHHFAFGVPNLHAPEPRAFVAPLEYAAVGCGMGPAIGAAVAHPERLTVLSIGDGGLMMTLGDLDTAVRYRLRIVVIVNDDGGFGSEVHYLRAHGLPEDLALFVNPSFADVAVAMGAKALKIGQLSDLDGVAAALADAQGPLVLDCKINRDVRGDWVDFFFGPTAAVSEPTAE